MVSIKDVAAAAGVFDKTVSRVVNKQANVKPGKVVRVEAAIDQLGYFPNQAARLVRTNRSRIIGVITDVVSTTPYSVELMRADDLTYVSGVGGRYLCHIEDQSKYCPYSWGDEHISHVVSDDYEEVQELMLNLVFKGTAKTAFTLDTKIDSIVAVVGKRDLMEGRLRTSSFIRQS